MWAAATLRQLTVLGKEELVVEAKKL